MADLRCPKCKNFIDEKNLDNCPGCGKTPKTPKTPKTWWDNMWKPENSKQYSNNTTLIKDAGLNLIKFRTITYSSLGVSSLGTLLLMSNLLVVGVILYLTGIILMLIAISKVGIAGEKLQRVDIKE
tara:strand:+ start:7766 stop:8143 length:378 start_codon:yes stop_codon:yes gene_type:complete